MGNHWTAGRDKLIAFSHAVDRTWIPSAEALVFLRGVQRGYRRVGLAGAPDAEKALAMVCLWKACCFPEQLLLVAAGSARAGQAWVRYLKHLTTESRLTALQGQLLFDEDSQWVRSGDRTSLCVLKAGQSLPTSVDLEDRSIVLFLPDFSRISTPRVNTFAQMLVEPDDQWLVVERAMR